jgi:hypothetical protein
MKRSQERASEAVEDLRDNLLMSLNHQIVSDSLIVRVYKQGGTMRLLEKRNKR